jgi:hypothetical protein
MHYNRPHATAKWGTMASDWEAGVDFAKLVKDRFDKAQASVKANGLGAVLTFNFDNIRYITRTHIGEWCRDKMNRYAICPADGGSFLFDPAVPAKRISSPWMEDRMEAPISTMLGALPPAMNAHKTSCQADQTGAHRHGGGEKAFGRGHHGDPHAARFGGGGHRGGGRPAGHAGRPRDQDPRGDRTFKQAAAMVDAVYEDIARAIRPGRREHELVALANQKLFLMGAERVECVNSVSGPRGKPHSHTFADRMIQPGDMIFLDLMHAFNGYRTCYYRTFICGKPNKYQMKTPMKKPPNGFRRPSMPSSPG